MQLDSIERPDITTSLFEHRAAEAKDRSVDAAEAGRRMEALFATLLVKTLRSALPNEGFFGDGPGADVFNGWMDEVLGERLAEGGALDLAGRIKVALEAKGAK